MTIDVLTIFPDFFSSALSTSIVGRALKEEKVSVQVHALRDFGIGKHQLTDDRPYGGGPGMVLLVEPIDAALIALGYKKGTEKELILLTSAKGELFTQQHAQRWTDTLERVCIICGHYEGTDERVAEHLVDAEIRIGDYVLTGGEPAAMVLIDALTRLQPEVLGNAESLSGESHEKPGQMGYPQYSRPASYKGWDVPAELQNGNHGEIAQWREKQRKSVITL